MDEVEKVLIENSLLIEKVTRFNEALCELKKDFTELKPVKEKAKFPYNNKFTTSEMNNKLFDRAFITCRMGLFTSDEPCLVGLYKEVPYFEERVKGYEFYNYIEIYGSPVYFEIGVYREYRIVPHQDWKYRAEALGYLEDTIDKIQEELDSEIADLSD